MVSKPRWRMSAAFGPWGDVWLRAGWRVQVHCVSGEARTLNPAGGCVALGRQVECVALAEKSAPSAGARRAAVLLHGLWNCPAIMTGLEAGLRAQGWAVANVGYPSMRCGLDAHGTAAAAAALALARDGAATVSFVGHSLGGLVARTAMAQAAAQGWTPGRLVLIGSPAGGSEIAGRFQNMVGYATVIGPCGAAVTPEGAARVALPVCKEVLVIAGGTGGRGYNPLLRGDNDGLIAVAETRLPDHETGFLLTRSLHKTLPTKPETIAACVEFLAAGRVAALR
jgi:pimeloyl-ACP methyl ester carboxylesterase